MLAYVATYYIPWGTILVIVFAAAIITLSVDIVRRMYP